MCPDFDGASQDLRLGSRQATVTARDFEAGERVEVDYAGDTLEWVELSTGEIHRAYVFVAGLGFSQLLFAWAGEGSRSRNWLSAHRRKFEFYGAVGPIRGNRAGPIAGN